MNKIDSHIEIVGSTMPGLSSMSLESREAIKAELGRHYKKVGITIVNNIDDLKRLVDIKPDLVFLGMKFIPSNPNLGQSDKNKIWISEYLDDNNIAYTGSNQPAHELELDKSLAKQRVCSVGLTTSGYSVAKSNRRLNESDIQHDYPLFIKPTNRGGGAGIDSFSVVQNFAEASSKVASLQDQFDCDSLIEEYLTGREFSVAILKSEESKSFTTMPLELVAPQDSKGQRLLSSAVKSADTESFLAVEEGSVKHSICKLALEVFNALGARSYGRIDIRLDQHGVPHFLEANLIPSLIKDYGNFPKACQLNEGISYQEMLLSIVRLGFEQSKHESIDMEAEIYSAQPQLYIAFDAN